MNFLIIGCGSIGKRHAANLISLGHNVAAYNRGEKRRSEMRRRFHINVYEDLEEMFNKEIADAALICTPNNFHLEHAISAAQHDLNLFIEKPLSHTLDGLEKLEREVSKRDLVSHVGTNMRFHFGPATVKYLLTEGKIGRPLWAHFWGGMHLPDWHPDEDYREMYSASIHMGGGAVLDFIHELDLVIWLFGVPKKVAGMTATTGWLDIETEDVADMILSYMNGFQVNIHMDYLQKPFQRGVRIVGEKGWVEWDLSKHKVIQFEYDNGRFSEKCCPEKYDHNSMYLNQIKYFIDCIEKNTRSFSDIGAGRIALEMALKIKKSSDKNIFI